MKLVREESYGAYECPSMIEGSRLHRLVVDRLSMPVFVTSTPKRTLWQRLLRRPAQEKTFELLPVYIGAEYGSGTGRFTLMFQSTNGHHYDVRYTWYWQSKWGDQYLPLLPELQITGLALLPTPPFADLTERGDPQDGNMEWTESFGSIHVMEDEVTSLIRGWADSLTEVPAEVPWMHHHWASYNGPSGDYGSTWPVKVKEGTTLQAIKEWASSLS